MAYSSPRRPRRRQQPQRAGRILVALVLLGLAIYFVTVSAAGNWVAQNLIAPLFQAASPSPALINEPALIDTPSSTPLASSNSQELHVNAFTVYCLQMGAFSSEQNAKNEADNLRARGAGGYVLNEGGHYRVLASAYDTQDEIQKVRDQLKTENIESGIYKIQAGEVALKITASDAQALALKNAMDAMTRARTTLGTAAQALDRAETTMEGSIASLRTLAESLRNTQTALKEAAKGSTSPVLDALDQWYSFTLNALASLSENTSQSTLDFSSQMKYTHIAVVCETRRFVESIETQ